MRVFKTFAPEDVVTASATPSPDGSATSVLFDNLLLDLDAASPGEDGPVGGGMGLARTLAYTFHLPTELKEQRPQIAVDLRYAITKSPGSLAKIVFAGAETLRSLDFAFGTTVNDSGVVTIRCPERRGTNGTPFTVTVILLAHRMNRDEHVRLQVDSLDLVARKLT